MLYVNFTTKEIQRNKKKHNNLDETGNSGTVDNKR